MDWTYAELSDNRSLRDFFSGELTHEDELKRFELVALSEPRDQVCYGAYRFYNKNTGEERVSAVVILLDGGRERLGYKILTEYDGPQEHHCPREIYDLLTRFRHCEESPQAIAWRNRVEAWHRGGGS